MENVTAKKSPRVLSIVGIPNSTIENIRIANCTFQGVEGADILKYAGDVAYRNVTVEPVPRARKSAD